MPPSRLRTAAPTPFRLRWPSELLPPDDVTDDKRHRKGRQDQRQDEEEQGRRPGELGRVAAEGVDRIEPAALLLPRRAGLPDPEDQDGRAHAHEAPQPR